MTQRRVFENKNFKKTTLAIGLSIAFANLHNEVKADVGLNSQGDKYTTLGTQSLIKDTAKDGREHSGIAISGASGDATVEAKKSIALGGNVTVSGIGSVNSIAIGTDSIVHAGKNIGSSNSLVIGSNSEVSGQKSVVIGYQSSVIGKEDEKTSGVAIGDNAKVTSKNSVAIGHFANSSDVDFDVTKGESQGSNLALGDFAKATSNYGIAMGTRATSSGYASLAMSYNANALSQYSVALGEAAIAGTRTNDTDVSYGEIAIGSKTEAIGKRSLAIGIKSKAEGDNSLIIGENSIASSDADQATAIGYNSAVTGEKSTAIGFGAKASGLNSLAQGSNAKANSENSVATGYNANATEANTIAIGSFAKTNAASAIAIGEKAVSTALNAVALGKEARSYGEKSLALGNNAITTQVATNSIAVGTNSTVVGVNGVSIGNETKANANAVALGSASKANGVSSIAIGETSNAMATDSMALGKNSVAQSRYAVALGYGTKAGESATSGYRSLSMGYLTSATKNDSIALGQNVNSTNIASIGLGRNVNNSGSGSIAIGDNVTVSAARSIAIGRNIDVTKEENIVLGSWSTETSATIENAGVIPENNKATVGNVEYGGFAGSKAIGVLSVGRNNTIDDATIDGERRIINVGAGEISERSTDAINGSQLFSVANKVSDIINNNYWNLNANDQLIGKISPTNTVNFKSTEGTVKITPKINNGSYDVDFDVKLGRGLTRNSTGAVEVSTTTINHDKENSMRFTTPRGMGNAYVTASDIARSLNEVGFKLSGSGEGDSFVDETDPDNEINDKRIINGNVFNLNAGKGVKITQIEKGYEIAVNNVDIEVENNKAKLPVGEGVENKMVSAKSIVDTINNTGFVLTTSATNGGEKDISAGDEVINPSDKIDLTAGKNLKVKQDENGKVTYSTKDDVEFTSVLSNKVSVGDVIINNEGINAGNKKITNVEKGVEDTDAVNVSQLKEIKNQQANALNSFTVSVKGDVKETINKDNNDVNFVDGDGTTVRATDENHITFDLSQTTKDNIQKGVDAHTTVTTKGINFVTENGETGVKKLGEAVKIKGDDKNISTKVENGDISVVLNDEIEVNKVTTGNTVMDNSGLVINNDEPNKVVSLSNTGLNNGGNKIVNVAEGTEDTDAVNVSQLNKKVTEINSNIAASKENVVSTDKTVTINKTIDDTTKATTFDLAVNIDNQTITKDTDGKLKAVTQNLENNEDGTVKDVAPENQTALVTTQTVANAINNSGFNIKTTGNLAEGNQAPSKLVKTGEEVVFEAGKNLTVKRIDNTITYATNDDVEFKTVKATTGVEVGDISVTIDNINMGNKKIVNLSEGIEGTDAVNVNQLNKAIENVSVASKENVVSTNKTVLINKTIDNTTNSTTFDLAVNTDNKTIKTQDDGSIAVITENLEVNNQGAIKLPIDENALITSKNVANAINNSGFNIKTTGNLAEGNQEPSKLVKTGEEVTFEAGDNLTIKRENNKITYATSKEVEFEKVKVKNKNSKNTINIDGDSITLNKNGNTNPNKEVKLSSEGLNNGGNRITNVADGVDDNDAVTVRQLKQNNQNIINDVDQKVGKIAQAVNKNNKELRAGIAGANAAAGLPQAYLPGKSMIAASAGTFKGENAIAVGYSRASDNGKLIIKLQGNANTRKDYGASVGVGYQW